MSVRIKLIQCTLVVLPFVAAAQTKQFITSVRSNESVRQSKSAHDNLEEAIQSAESTSTGGAVDTGESVNTLPLFGERPKTTAQIDEEIHFLNDCDRNFASRSEASTDRKSVV